MTTETIITVTLTKTRKRINQSGLSATVDGSGWTLYGNVGSPNARKWLERWFETAAKAQAYADKRGYVVKPLASACPQGLEA